MSGEGQLAGGEGVQGGGSLSRRRAAGGRTNGGERRQRVEDRVQRPEARGKGGVAGAGAETKEGLPRIVRTRVCGRAGGQREARHESRGPLGEPGEWMMWGNMGKAAVTHQARVRGKRGRMQGAGWAASRRRRLRAQRPKARHARPDTPASPGWAMGDWIDADSARAPEGRGIEGNEGRQGGERIWRIWPKGQSRK